MNKWEIYPKNRKIQHKEDYILIVPFGYSECIEEMPLFCEVCEFRYILKQDEESYKLFRCCSSCADNWAYSNKQKWVEGWRPTEEQIKLAVEKRLFVNPHIQFE